MQSESETLDVIPRTAYYSNKSMYEQMELLKSVVLAKKTIKERVGRKYEEREVLKFKTDQEVIDRIVRKRNVVLALCKFPM